MLNLIPRKTLLNYCTSPNLILVNLYCKKYKHLQKPSCKRKEFLHGFESLVFSHLYKSQSILSLGGPKNGLCSYTFVAEFRYVSVWLLEESVWSLSWCGKSSRFILNESGTGTFVTLLDYKSCPVKHVSTCIVWLQKALGIHDLNNN